MRGYIVIVFTLCTSLSAMYDSSKRLKLSDSTESVTYSPLDDLVRQSHVYRAFREDTGASEQECLDVLTTPAEQMLLEAYALQKQKDPSSLVARSYKALGVAQFATLANVANKLDIPNAYHEILDDLGQKINDLTQKKQYQQIDQVQFLDADARGELGKRMSLHLLAGLRMVSFADKARMNPSKFPVNIKKYSASTYNNYFPIDKKIFELDCKKLLDCTLAADSKSIVAVVKNSNNQMESLLIDSTTSEHKSLKKETYRPGYYVEACPDGVSHIFHKKPQKVTDESEDQSESEDSEDDLIDLPQVPVDMTEGMRLVRDWSIFSPDGSEYFEMYATQEDAPQGGLFTLVSRQKESDLIPIFTNKQYNDLIKDFTVSNNARFCAIATYVHQDLQEQLGEYGCIYLDDAQADKQHIIHGKNNDEDFRLRNIVFNDDESALIVTAEEELFVLDLSKPLPDIIDIKQHAVEHHRIPACYEYLRHYQSEPFLPQWTFDEYDKSVTGLFKNNEFLMRLEQRFATEQEFEHVPTRLLDTYVRHIELADMSTAYGYIKTITSMTPQQAALVSSLIKQNEIIKDQIAKETKRKDPTDSTSLTLPSIKKEILLDQREQHIYADLHEDIKRHLLKDVTVAAMTSEVTTNDQ